MIKTNAILKSIVLFALLLLAACGSRVSQQESDADIRVDLAPESTVVGPTTLNITVTDGGGAPIDDATLNVKGDMSHAGMTPVLAEGIDGGQQGLYTAPFEWTMAGDWIVTVDVSLPDGRSTSQRFELAVSGDGAMDDMPEQ
ncbi:MAG: FixH family protein [bacterium]